MPRFFLFPGRPQYILPYLYSLLNLFNTLLCTASVERSLRAASLSIHLYRHVCVETIASRVKKPWCTGSQAIQSCIPLGNNAQVGKPQKVWAVERRSAKRIINQTDHTRPIRQCRYPGRAWETPSAIFFSPKKKNMSDTCTRCQKAIFAAEQPVRVPGGVYHDACFKCKFELQHVDPLCVFFPWLKSQKRVRRASSPFGWRSFLSALLLRAGTIPL